MLSVLADTDNWEQNSTLLTNDNSVLNTFTRHNKSSKKKKNKVKNKIK